MNIYTYVRGKFLVDLMNIDRCLQMSGFLPNSLD